MRNILPLLLIVLSSCVIEVLNLVNSDLYQEPVFYDWNDQPGFNDVPKQRRYEHVYRNGDYNNMNNRERNNDRTLTKTDDVKHFLKGAVNKVWSWFGKKTEPDYNQGPNSGSTGVGDIRVIGGILKGIHNIFKKSVPIIHSDKRYQRQLLDELTEKPLKRGWIFAQFGMTPENVFVAGYTFDGIEIYIAKGLANDTADTAAAGTLKAGRRCVRIPAGDWARCIFKYQILIGNSYIWYPTEFNKDTWEIHPHSLVAGRETTKKGDPLTNYICRAYHKMDLLVGKLQTEEYAKYFRKCVVPYRGITIPKLTYDILLDWWE